MRPFAAGADLSQRLVVAVTLSVKEAIEIDGLRHPSHRYSSKQFRLAFVFTFGGARSGSR
jgi:hypothetical protein